MKFFCAKLGLVLNHVGFYVRASHPPSSANQRQEIPPSVSLTRDVLMGGDAFRHVYPSKMMALGTFCHRRCFFLLALLIGTTAFAPPCHYCYIRTILHAANEEDTTTTRIWTEAELMEFASEQGVTISLSTLGPGYRAVARTKHNSALILGYVEGFLRPGVLHLDKMEVFRKQVLQARAENPDEFKQGGTVFGVGLLMGYLCLLYGM